MIVSNDLVDLEIPTLHHLQPKHVSVFAGTLQLNVPCPPHMRRDTDAGLRLPVRGW